MYFSVVILILMQVTLMSCGGERACACEVKIKWKRNRTNGIFGNGLGHPRPVINELKPPLADGTSKVVNLLASNSRQALLSSEMYGLPRIETRGENYCPIIPDSYHKVYDIPYAYKPYTSEMTWKDAQLQCQSDAGELALPQDEWQFRLITQYAESMLSSADTHIFVGFYRLSSTKNWTTVHGKPLPFEQWANYVTYDDAADQSRCGGMLISVINTKGFTSESCDGALPFMCEIMIPSKCA